jgi:diaminopimelate epimerase
MAAMKIRFTKMQGAGNDFVVLDETQGRFGLEPAHYRFLADRHFGVGADQILSVRAPTPEDAAAGIAFGYVIHNADGGEVENCGNGARCFARYVHERGLTQDNPVRVRTASGVLSLAVQPDGRVTVDMGAPVFELARVPFEPGARTPMVVGSWQMWPLDLKENRPIAGANCDSDALIHVAVLSMGNPHAVLRVDDVARAEVEVLGPCIEHHPAFPRRVNAGFMQVVDRSNIRLRVFERGAGETLACGTGACAAVVAGIRLGWLDSRVDVRTRGGRLTIEWSGRLEDSVHMTGPAVTVFEGEIELPEHPAGPDAPLAPSAP